MGEREGRETFIKTPKLEIWQMTRDLQNIIWSWCDSSACSMHVGAQLCNKQNTFPAGERFTQVLYFSTTCSLLDDIFTLKKQMINIYKTFFINKKTLTLDMDGLISITVQIIQYF